MARLLGGLRRFFLKLELRKGAAMTVKIGLVGIGFMGGTHFRAYRDEVDGAEVIAVCDGSWPDPPLDDHPRLQVIHFTEPVGQRAATNAGAMLSKAKYVMKMDAHCSTEDNFDEKLTAKMQPDWTMIPSMHRLHVYDWMCECGEREYQGSKPDKCKECGRMDFTMAMVWEPRWQFDPTISWRFDDQMRFQYWRKHRRRPG